MRIFRWIWNGIRISLHIIWRLLPAVFYIIGQCLRVMYFAGVASFRNIPKECRKLSETLTTNVIRSRGIESEFEGVLRDVFLVVAWAFMFLGWVLLAYVTIIILAFISVVL